MWSDFCNQLKAWREKNRLILRKREFCLQMPSNLTYMSTLPWAYSVLPAPPISDLPAPTITWANSLKSINLSLYPIGCFSRESWLTRRWGCSLKKTGLECKDWKRTDCCCSSVWSQPNFICVIQSKGWSLLGTYLKGAKECVCVSLPRGKEAGSSTISPG